MGRFPPQNPKEKNSPTVAAILARTGRTWQGRWVQRARRHRCQTETRPHHNLVRPTCAVCGQADAHQAEKGLASRQIQATFTPSCIRLGKWWLLKILTNGERLDEKNYIYFFCVHSSRGVRRNRYSTTYGLVVRDYYDSSSCLRFERS